jgi:hypothetical protein
LNSKPFSASRSPSAWNRKIRPASVSRHQPARLMIFVSVLVALASLNRKRPAKSS